MDNKKFDTFFKANLKQNVNFWDKQAAWDRLNKKRKKRLRKQISVLSIIILMILSTPLLVTKINKPKHNNTLTEFQKRQKLLKIELELSKSYNKNLLCENCNWNHNLKTIQL